MKYNYIIIVLLLLSSLILRAQEAIFIEGKVLNDTIETSNLHVVNMTLEHGTVTTGSGNFTIKARLNDVINISAVQYESRQFVVDEKVFQRGSISLYLIPKITALDEVNISNIELSGDLNKDIKNTTYAATITAEELGLPQNTAPKRTVEERRYYTAVSSGGGIPLDGLINSITGRLKMLKKHIEVSRFQKLVEDSRYMFSDSLYMKELNIPQELIEDFVYYTFEDSKAKSLINRNDALGLLEFMKTKAHSYRALKAEE